MPQTTNQASVSVDLLGTADFADARYAFTCSVARNEGTILEQTGEALRQACDLLEESGLGNDVIRVEVFLRNPMHALLCRRAVRKYFERTQSFVPLITLISQPPLGGEQVAVELMAVGDAQPANGRKQFTRQIKHLSEQFTHVSHGEIDWVYASFGTPAPKAPHVYNRSAEMFQSLEASLARGGAKYSQVIRTWLYLGDIVGPIDQTQRYKELNRARADYYENIKFGDGRVAEEIDWEIYPASTGIGTCGEEVVGSAVALLSERNDIKLLPLENPLQTAAFDYREHYSPKSPKFSRAMAVALPDEALIFISGTASITASETRYIGDPAGQTNQTLDNIAALIAADNFRQHGHPGIGATLEDLKLARVYVKNVADYEAVRRVCQSRLSQVPLIYTHADVCRDDLLVEIEGIAFAH